MKKTKQGTGIFVVLVIMSFWIGSYILAATFFGIVTLIGLIALVESIRPLKWLVRKTSSLIDILIFIFTIVAVTAYGLNIAASLTIAGVGYTLIYAPYVRESYHIKKYGKPRANRPTDNCKRM
jgi:nitrate reductase gamma subunit